MEQGPTTLNLFTIAMWQDLFIHGNDHEIAIIL